MTDLLLALPIKGEAFLLRRGRHSILVDGGWNGAELAKSLRNHAADLATIDVVLCTHADRDHSGGLSTILDHWPGRIRQFWLPGSWVDVVPELFADPAQFVSGLIADLQAIADEHPNLTGPDADSGTVTQALDRIVQGERTSRDADARPAEGRDGPPRRSYERPDFLDPFEEFESDIDETLHLDEPQWFRQLREELGEGSYAAAMSAFRSGRGQVTRLRRTRAVGNALAQFWLGLIQTAEIIRRMAEQAIRHRIRVRWFDHDEFARSRIAQGGVPGFLLPLNAVEQAREPQLELSYLARLSPVNEACLAFIAPPTWTRLGVAFCGDSPLGDGLHYTHSQLTEMARPYLPIVATAPHHGSESNRAAYGHLVAWARVLSWLRTGGSSDHPGVTFKNLAFPRRVCTHCPQTKRRSQLASIAMTIDNRWYGPLLIQGHQCVCT